MRNGLSYKGVALIGVFATSFASILIRLSTTHPITIAAYRLVLAALMLLPYVILQNRKQQTILSKRMIIRCILSGLFLSLHFVTWIASLQYTSITGSVVLVSTHPVFIVLYYILVRRKSIKSFSLISIGITLAGIITIALGDYTSHPNALWGDLLALLGGFFMACYLLSGHQLRQEIPNTTYIFWVYLFGGIISLFICLVADVPLHPIGWTEWALMTAIALICTILGHGLINKALEGPDALFVSTATLSEPVFASIWALILFKEAPAFHQIAGAVIILIGLYLYNRSILRPTINPE